RERERERERESKNTYFTFRNLLKAYYDCRKRKRKTANAARVELNFEKELLKLEQELQSRTYSPGKSICFVVTYPTIREIFAADFRDRIVHHLLVSYLEPIFEKKFIHHSFACRKDKGAHAAIKFLKRFARKITGNFSRPAYYLQVDVAAFFMSLRKDILFDIIKKHTKDPEILWLARKIIFHDPTRNFYRKGNPELAKLVPKHKSLFHVPKGQGLPIGNLTSQFFANVYLNKLDQFIKHDLKAKYYLRYVDDFILIHENPKQLKIWKKQIDHFLREELKIKLHPKKSIQKSVYKGINFAGFIVKPGYLLVRRRTVNNLKQKLHRFNSSMLPKNNEEFQKSLYEILSTINSYYGQFRHADTARLKKDIFYKHFGILKSYLKPSDQSLNSFKIKTFQRNRHLKDEWLPEE
ncbi:MAG: reverse transcriptase/maturase family protein, partial [Candidatus Moranbacteria bacterium]|nr:reverse transcriptase/maturase family protein [Candidatus Moranbacteria bacterium]